jgi:hypothetical protein
MLSDQILKAAVAWDRRYQLADVARQQGRDPKDGSVRNALGALVTAGLMDRNEEGYAPVQDAGRGKGAKVQEPLPGVAPLHSCTPRISRGIEDSRGEGANEGTLHFVPAPDRSSGSEWYEPSERPLVKRALADAEGDQ